MKKNKSAQHLGRLSAQSRDTSPEAMRSLVSKRWEKERLKKELMNKLFSDERVQGIINEYLNEQRNNN